MISRYNNLRKIAAFFALTMVLSFGVMVVPSAALAATSYSSPKAEYASHEKPIVDAYRNSFNGSLAQTIVGRAIWYMEYGYTVYGHTSYATTGYIDCSQFVSRVYKDFGYSFTGASRKYGSVGWQVQGVYAKKISGSSKYTLVGVNNLRPGDIFTFWKTGSNGTYIGHVAIYMGVINGKPCILNTCTGRPTALGIINDFSYWYGQHLYQVRRVLPDSAYQPGGTINDKGPVIPAVYHIYNRGPIVMPRNLSAGF